ncbi:MAG: DUF1298 domain-containing protein [Dactylosporangium sp.]|nr:DUF1298 domain-containing protein [Dactylosporangium sp.]NNJ62419.1 DUF1298 domain-containing protein [Dactylosporangium sp.]
MTAPIERASANDLMHLTYDRGPCPVQVGAVLRFEAGTPLEVERLRSVFAERVPAVPRLRQRLTRVPLGCGRPVWVDDPAFNITNHVTTIACPSPGGERALLDLAAALVTTPLPADRPPWSAVLVTGCPQDRPALVMVLHHVLTDGTGALAVLACLVDGGQLAECPEDTPDSTFPRPAPSRFSLAAEALRGRALGALRAWRLLPRLYHAAVELRVLRLSRTRRCSLNTPTGPRRTLALARCDLASARTAARAAGGTVNDVLLTAVTGALGALLRDRGEVVDRLTASVLVSGRLRGRARQLDNQIGVILATLPTTGDQDPDAPDPAARLRRTAEITRARRARVRGASATVVEPLFRWLSALGLATWFFTHQRRVSMFVTTLRGPARPLALLGRTIEELVPVSGTAGNVTVAFAALSYAGSLTVTIVADTDACPDVQDLATHLRAELDRLVTVPAR